MNNIIETNLDELRLSTDFKYFCKWSGPDPLTNRDIIITPQHLDLLKLLMNGKDSVVVAYRGFGKSTIIAYKYALRKAIMHHKTIAIFSATEDLAVDKLRIVKTAIESFPQLHRFLGKGIYTWNDKEIWLIDRTKGRQGTDGKMSYPVISIIKAIGFESKSRGTHVDIIVADDIVVEENTLTVDGAPDQQKIEKVKRDFNAKTVPIRNPGGSIILVGTPQFRSQEKVNESDLLYVRTKKKNKNVFLLPALNEADEPTCPTLHSKEFLLEQKNSIRLKEWSKEYMLNPITTNESSINEDILDRAKDFNSTYTIDYIPRPDEVVILGTDYVYESNKLKAEAKKLAYFALVVVAYNKRTDKRKVINISYERGVTFTEQIFKTISWIKKYGASVLALELFGGLKLFEGELKRLVPPHVSIIDAGNRAGKYNLIDGLPSLEYLFTKDLIVLPYKDLEDQEKTNWLLYELKNMKASQHVDVIDALLRVDTIIRKYYYTGSSNPNFSLRDVMKGKDIELTNLDLEMSTVFGRPTKKELEVMRKEKENQHRMKSQLDNLEHNIWVKLQQNR